MPEHELLKKILMPLVFSSVISSMAGISLMLRNSEVVRPRDVWSAVLASVAACSIVFLLLAEHLVNKPYLHYGISSLAGSGGASTLDWLMAFLRKKLGKLALDEDEGRSRPKGLEEE